MTRRKSRGFTLLEVLIALAIVALAVGALLGSVTSSASNVVYIKDKTIAQWVALNQLTAMRISKLMPQPGKRTGFSEMAGAKYQWESEVIELPVKGMFRIDVHVRSTGEPADDKHPPEKPTQQKDPESSDAGGDLDKVNWETTVTGVVGSSRSDLQSAVGAEYAGSGQSGPNNPGGGAANPNAPGNTSPGNPAPGGTPTTAPVRPRPGGSPITTPEG